MEEVKSEKVIQIRHLPENVKLVEKLEPLIQPVTDQVKDYESAKTMLESLDKETIIDAIFVDTDAGHIFFMEVPLMKGKILETVSGILEKDTANTVYEATSIFNSRQELIKVRVDMIQAIGKAFDTTEPEAIVLSDQGRDGRNPSVVLLREMPTAQLFDVLKAVSTPKVAESLIKGV